MKNGSVKPGAGGGGSTGGGSGGGTAGSVGTFQPCFVNAGSIAASSPCSGAPGTKIAIKLSRAISAPLVQAIFKPYSIALPSATAAQVLAALKGNGTASGSVYDETSGVANEGFSQATVPLTRVHLSLTETDEVVDQEVFVHAIIRWPG